MLLARDALADGEAERLFLLIPHMSAVPRDGMRPDELEIVGEFQCTPNSRSEIVLRGLGEGFGPWAQLVDVMNVEAQRDACVVVGTGHHWLLGRLRRCQPRDPDARLSFDFTLHESLPNHWEDSLQLADRAARVLVEGLMATFPDL